MLGDEVARALVPIEDVSGVQAPVGFDLAASPPRDHQHRRNHYEGEAELGDRFQA